MLHRFWVRFTGENNDVFPFQNGCGVTAYDLEDAIYLLQTKEFRKRNTPKIASIIVDIDVSTLDADHILPNLGICSNRGIWFPNLQ